MEKTFLVYLFVKAQRDKDPKCVGYFCLSHSFLNLFGMEHDGLLVVEDASGVGVSNAPLFEPLLLQDELIIGQGVLEHKLGVVARQEHSGHHISVQPIHANEPLQCVLVLLGEGQGHVQVACQHRARCAQ